VVFGTGARDDLSATDDSELLRPSRGILFPERAAASYLSMLHARPPARCQAAVDVDIAWSACIAVTKAGSLLAAEIENLRIGDSGVLGRRQIRVIELAALSQCKVHARLERLRAALDIVVGISGKVCIFI
jgi:hypothetical protein